VAAHRTPRSRCRGGVHDRAASRSHWPIAIALAVCSAVGVRAPRSEAHRGNDLHVQEQHGSGSMEARARQPPLWLDREELLARLMDREQRLERNVCLAVDATRERQATHELERRCNTEAPFSLATANGAPSARKARHGDQQRRYPCHRVRLTSKRGRLRQRETEPPPIY